MKDFSRRLLPTILPILFFITQQCSFSENTNALTKPWQELISDPQYSAGQSLRFYRLKTKGGSKAALVVFDLNDGNFVCKPFFCNTTTSTSDVAKQNKALVAVNGGYFNLSNGESTSYVVIDKKNQCEPKDNEALINNPDLKPFMTTILNRSELRILENEKGKHKACIALHKDPIPANWILLHSIQAGPRLLPSITDCEEAFVRQSSDGKTVDAIGSHKRAARTAIGVTPDNHLLLLCVANKGQEEFSSGITLDELAQMLRDLGCSEALNLDGGTSTTLIAAQGDFRDPSNYSTVQMISSKPEKLVKSGLLFLRTPYHSSNAPVPRY